MIKRGNLSIRKILAIPQLFILILSMFAVSFIFSQTNFVTAGGETQGVTGTATKSAGIVNKNSFTSIQTGSLPRASGGIPYKFSQEVIIKEIIHHIYPVREYYRRKP